MGDNSALHEVIRTRVLLAMEPGRWNFKGQTLKEAHKLCRDELSVERCCEIAGVKLENIPEDIYSCIPAMAATTLVNEMINDS